MAIVDILVVVLLAVMAYLVLQGRKRTGPADDAPRIDAETQYLRDEVLELRARVQVLERVITDNHGAADLDREIDRLRDR